MHSVLEIEMQITFGLDYSGTASLGCYRGLRFTQDTTKTTELMRLPIFNPSTKAQDWRNSIIDLREPQSPATQKGL